MSRALVVPVSEAGCSKAFFPQRANWFVIMGRVRRNRQPFVCIPRNDHAIAHFPLRNFESGDAKRSQTRPHVIGNHAEVFPDHTRGAGFFHNDAQVFFAFALVRFAMFSGVSSSRGTKCGARPPVCSSI